MSLEQQVANLVEASNNLTGAVNGKIGEIDERMTEAEQEFEQFQSSADDRYMTRTGKSVYVGGDADKFYPVFIPAVHAGIANLQISRAVHDDRTWAGAMTAQFLLQNNSWGGYPSFFVMDAYGHAFHGATGTPADVKTDGFISDYENGVVFVYGAIFWLRGNHTYRISSSLKNYDTVTVFQDLVTTRVFNTNDIQVFLSGFDITSDGYTKKAEIKTERNLTRIPSLSYVRGI